MICLGFTWVLQWMTFGQYLFCAFEIKGADIAGTELYQRGETRDILSIFSNDVKAMCDDGCVR